MMTWAQRARALHGELSELADIAPADPRWWLVAGGAALGWPVRADYIVSDAEPAADTFIGSPTPDPGDVVGHAIARAHAARAAIRALDGALPGQKLAVTVARTAAGARSVASRLEVAAFAIGDRCWAASLADRAGNEGPLTADLRRVLAGGAPRVLRPIGATPVPFVAITLGDEPAHTARHGHRRAWTSEALAEGPWLGLSRAGGLAIASTCHMVVDGYGHAWLASRIAELTAATTGSGPPAPPPTPVAGAIALDLVWRPLPLPAPRAVPLAYALGCALHAAAGRGDARRSPTIQIPVAPGRRGDPQRPLRRVVPALASVHVDAGRFESYARFAARTREILLREATGTGLSARLLAAAQAAPAPLAWKRRAVSPDRPRWLGSLAEVLGGRGCVSRITLGHPAPPLCAVSAPAQPGGCVVTVIEDGDRAAITVCGVGATDALLDQLITTAQKISHDPREA